MENMTIDPPCVNDTHATYYRWPAHLASNMTDSIRHQVKGMLGQSRLIQNPDGIELMRPDDIWKVDRVLGAGAFSQVSQVTTMDGRNFACKHLKAELMAKPEDFRTAAAELAYEAHMLSSFDHPNILKIRGWARNGIASFEDGRHNSFFLLLDLLDETLDQRVERWSNEPIMDERTAHMTYMEKLQHLIEIASALDYVHERGVIYRDLKPNNIGLLNGQVQLFDLGLSRELPVLDTTTPFQMSGRVGTIRYMAPEVVLHQPYNVAADVYSWSMVAYELLTLEKPYSGWTPELHAEYVCQRGIRPDIGTLPTDMQRLLQLSWHADPSQRPNLKHIIAQLQLDQEREGLVMEEQELHWQLQRQRQLDLQRQQGQQRYSVSHVPTHDPVISMSLNTSFFDTYSSPRKIRRSHSSESFGTIETDALSADSLGW
jgi:serine/threonine protein kinase